jgi:hypothetical protein
MKGALWVCCSPLPSSSLPQILVLIPLLLKDLHSLEEKLTWELFSQSLLILWPKNKLSFTEWFWYWVQESEREKETSLGQKLVTMEGGVTPVRVC